jgi:quinol monooxygenase YgiN
MMIGRQCLAIALAQEDNRTKPEEKTDMIVITAAVKAMEGKEEELREVLEAMVNQVRDKEPDCFEYTLHQGIEDKTRFSFYERYRNLEAIELHKNTDHFKQLIADTETLLAEPIDVQILEIIK